MNARDDFLHEFRTSGFAGFESVGALKSDRSRVPKGAGVYAVLYPDTDNPAFLECGSGGRFKGKDPNVRVDLLAARWVAGPTVLYFGKANASSNGRGLQKRIGELLLFGSGRAIAHWGGRHLWQLASIDEMLLCWKETPGLEPRAVEKALIADFAHANGKPPFANISR